MISELEAKSILAERLNVSRETMQDFEMLVEILVKWNKSINLVGKATLQDVWARHILDSAQLWQHRPAVHKNWVDMGSGGGFPGLILAILAKNEAPDVKFHLIESDARKCAYLRNVSRETSLNIQIQAKRIDEVKGIQADVVSARALAPVDKLIEYAQNFMAKTTYCLFLKGQSCAKEVENAQHLWRFESEQIKSLTDASGVILKTWNIERA